MNNLNKIKTGLKRNYFDAFIIIEFIMCVSICVVSVFELFPIEAALHLCIYLLLFVTFAAWIIKSAFEEKRPTALFIMLMLIITSSFVIITISYATNENSLFAIKDYYTKYIMFIGSLTLFFVAYKGEFSLKTVKILIYIIMAIVFLFILFYFILGDTNYNFNHIVTRYLTFNLGNPNRTAVMLLIFFLYMFIGVALFKNKWLKSICGVFAVILFLMLYKTYSRNMMIAAFVFLSLAPVIYLKKTRGVRNSFWAALFIAPICFAIVYMLFIDNKALTAIFSFMESEGKELSSRQKMWQIALDNIGQRPVWGSYYELWVENNSNLHNTLLDTLAVYGSGVFILFCVFMYELFKKFNMLCVNRIQQIALLAFSVALLTGLGESTLFAGSSGVFILCGGFLVLVKGSAEAGVVDKDD